MDDKEDFSNLYKINHKKVYNMIGRYVSNACSIEDLVSHTFMRAWISRHSFRGDSSYSTWLMAIAKHSSINHLVQQTRTPSDQLYHVDPESCPGDDDVLTGIINQEDMAAIYEAIEKLPQDLKNVVVLNIVYGLSYEEIAQATNTPLGTVKSRYHRARFQLKDLLR